MGMTRNVLVITYVFPPLNRIASRRFGEILPYLEPHGWRPWVITTHADGPLPVRIPEAQILRIGQTVQQGIRIDQPPLTGTAGTLRRMLRAFHFQLYSVNRTLGWVQDVWRLRDRITARLPQIDAVIVTVPFGPQLLLGKWFGRWFGAPWIADFRDLTALLDDDRSRLSVWIDRIVERWSLRGVRAISTTGDTWAEILRKAYRRPTNVIYNGWDSAPDQQGGETAAMETAGKPYLYYAGCFYKHRRDSLAQVLDALIKCPELAFRIRSLGPDFLEDELLAAARERRIDNRVRILPPCDPPVVEREMREATAVLVLESLDAGRLSTRGMLTGKFLGLLPSSVPILFVARPDSDAGPILLETGRGELCSSASEITHFLERAANHPDRYRGCADRIARYAKVEQARHLAGMLDYATQAGNART